MYNYSYIGNDEEQFSAITIEIDNNLVYVLKNGIINEYLLEQWFHKEKEIADWINNRNWGDILYGSLNNKSIHMNTE